MCRSIQTLRPPFHDEPTEADIRAAALQYVRKVSGFRTPAAHNEQAFTSAVDAIAERARAAGILEWEPRQEPYPVGYYCGLRDPDGNFVEFSYGQPLGPGAQA